MLVRVVLKVIWQNKELELELTDKATVQDLLLTLQNKFQISEVFVVHKGKIQNADYPLIANADYQIYPSISGG